jgi:hypothetical protein
MFLVRVFSLHFGNKQKIKGLPDSVARILPSEFPTLTYIPSVCSSDFPEKEKNRKHLKM